MTIRERIKKIKNTYGHERDKPILEKDLFQLAEQVAREQRIICSVSFDGWDDKLFPISDKILNASPPLNNEV